MPICPWCATENPEHARFCLSCGRPLEEPPPSESRRQVTVLFTDLAGSTELTHRLDAETLHVVLEDYFGAARAAVAAFGGRIEKFIGDAVMAVFGYPTANEDDALRAIRAAWDMRQRIETANGELRRRWNVELAARTGIATGTVVASDRTTGEPIVMGTPVNLAARLEQHAGAKEILIDATTQRIVRLAVEAEPLTLDQVRGFDGPVTAHRVTAVAAPGEGLLRPEPPFVNRTPELRLLHETFESHAASPRCRSVTVIGSAGLGKTRLIAEFLRRHPDADVVLQSRCPAHGEGGALQPLIDVVGQAAGFTAQDDAATAIERIHELLADHPQGGLATDAVSRALGLRAETTTQEEAAWSIRTCLETVARRGPLVLAIDDLHWAAPVLLDILEHLAEWARDAPILLLCLARPELLNQRPTWGRTPGAVTLQLEPLASAPSRELARHLLEPAAATGGVEDTITAVADGNPFFLEEIVTMLQEEGAIGVDGATTDLSHIAIPPTISALLAARIDRLDAQARQVLERAAVLGLAFSDDEVEALLPDDPDLDVGGTLRDLAQRDFLVLDGAAGRGYRFRHALTREATYGAIPKSLRVRLHSAAAERLEGAPESEARDERIGYHLERAFRAMTDLGESGPATSRLGERAGAHLAAAGRAAAGRGDVRAAAGLLERSSDLLPRDNADRPVVLADLHDALLFAGEIERSETPVAELLASLPPDDDGPLAERARLQLSMLRFLLDPSATPMDTLRKEVERSVARIEASGDEGSLAWALADLATIHWVEGNAAAMLQASERALAHALSCGSRRATAEAAPLIAFALHRGAVPLDVAIERVDEVRGRLKDDRLAETLLLLDQAMMLAEVGRAGDAHRALDEAHTTFADLGQRRWLETAKSVRGELARREGRFEQAEALLRSVLEFFREQGDALNALQLAAALGDALCDLGHVDEADLLASEVARDGPLDDIELQVTWRVVRARTRSAAGDPDGAIAIAQEAVAIADPTDFVLLQAEAHRIVADAHASAGHLDEARRSLEQAITRYESKRASRPAAEARQRFRDLDA